MPEFWKSVLGGNNRSDFDVDTGSNAILAPLALPADVHFASRAACQLPSTTSHFGGFDASIVVQGVISWDAEPTMSMSAIARTRFFVASFMLTYCAVRASLAGRILTPVVSRPRDSSEDRTKDPARSSAMYVHRRTLFAALVRCAAVATLWPTPPIDCWMEAGFEVFGIGVIEGSL